MLAGKCILKAPKRASYYYGVLNTMGNVLFYIILICQPAKYKTRQGQPRFYTLYYSDHTVKSYTDICSSIIAVWLTLFCLDTGICYTFYTLSFEFILNLYF
jgi:hypothetical protein